jgi:hypothetical protein
MDSLNGRHWTTSVVGRHGSQVGSSRSAYDGFRGGGCPDFVAIDFDEQPIYAVEDPDLRH